MSPVRTTRADQWGPIAGRGDVGSSTILKWGTAVCAVAASEADVRTVRAWAALVNMSVSSLRETCSLVGINAKTSLDFSRILRVVVKSPHRWQPEFYLDVSDRRTLRRLTQPAGLGVSSKTSRDDMLPAFFANQRFIEAEIPLLTIRQLLSCERGARVRPGQEGPHRASCGQNELRCRDDHELESWGRQ